MKLLILLHLHILVNKSMNNQTKLLNYGIDPANLNKLTAMQAISKFKQNERVKYG